MKNALFFLEKPLIQGKKVAFFLEKIGIRRKEKQSST